MAGSGPVLGRRGKERGFLYRIVADTNLFVAAGFKPGSDAAWRRSGPAPCGRSGTRPPAGGRTAAAELLPLVYEELRRLAAEKLARERPGQTLQATALVHEAYVRLVGGGGESHWDGRRHFFAAAAEAMRRILIDAARRKLTGKHGGDRRRIDLDDVEAAAPSRAADLVALDEALTRFAAEDSVKARLVTLRYFSGLSVEEAADVLGISRATADRYWAYARTWLYCELGGREADPESRKKTPGG